MLLDVDDDRFEQASGQIGNKFARGYGRRVMRVRRAASRLLHLGE